ncbi:methylated-DNA--[protein]-cysteine S-methyltransferase [soil metagenome]
MTYWTTTDTPTGPFTFVADDDVVLTSGWTDDVAVLLERIGDDVRPAEVSERTGASRISDAVTAYHGGDLTAPDAIAVRQASGPFITAAWAALRKVEAGEVITYTDLAARAGRPAAVRAAASACARNHCALFVPCHRVVRRDRGMGGFAWGVGVKRWLLDHEQPTAQLDLG